MGPLRIIILAVLVYIGYRLLKSSFTKGRSQNKSASGNPPTGGRITDVLVEDPVCGKLVPQGQSHKVQRDGQTYYFCSEDCSKKFASQKGENE